MQMLGYVPSEMLKGMILQSVNSEGITLEEACSRYGLPPLYINEVPDDCTYSNSFRPPIVITNK